MLAPVITPLVVDSSDETVNLHSPTGDPWVEAKNVYGISSRELILLIAQRAPPILFSLLLCLRMCKILPIQEHMLIDGIEYFAGVAEI